MNPAKEWTPSGKPDFPEPEKSVFRPSPAAAWAKEPIGYVLAPSPATDRSGHPRGRSFSGRFLTARIAFLGGTMKKALFGLALMGLLTSAAFAAPAQQEDRPTQPQRQQPGQPGQPGQQQQQQQPMSPDEVFARLDADRDGKLTEAEFARAQAGGSAQEKKQQFSEWDSNGDGAISKEEFTAKHGPGGR
jgi:hypothetical protein